MDKTFLVVCFLVGLFVCLSTLNILSHSIMAFKVSAEKSIDSIMTVFFLMTSFFSIAALKILTSLICDNFIITCLG